MLILRPMPPLRTLHPSTTQVPRPVTNSLSPPREEEAILYLGVGAAVAFIASAALLVCFTCSVLVFCFIMTWFGWVMSVLGSYIWSAGVRAAADGGAEGPQGQGAAHRTEPLILRYHLRLLSLYQNPKHFYFAYKSSLFTRVFSD